jgi:hypothetical protein
MLPLNYGYPAGHLGGAGGLLVCGTVSFSATDAPATIAQTTYNVDFYNYNDTVGSGANTTVAQYQEETSTLVLIELANVG